jgi:hypothetical protein
MLDRFQIARRLLRGATFSQQLHFKRFEKTVVLRTSERRGHANGLPPLSGPASMREFGAVSCPAVQAGA